MKVMTGRVVDGKINVEGALKEGESVAVLALDDLGLELTKEEEAELADSLAAVQRGEYVDGHELLRELRGPGGR